jgi:hypothetical protein
MREINFMAWDSFNKEMLTMNKMGMFIGTGSYSFLMVINYEQGVIPVEILPIQDKNNKPFYDGAIVSASFGNMVVRFGMTKGVLGWALFDNMTCANGSALINDDWEIIGNVYQNPELLTN